MSSEELNQKQPPKQAGDESTPFSNDTTTKTVGFPVNHDKATRSLHDLAQSIVQLENLMGGVASRDPRGITSNPSHAIYQYCDDVVYQMFATFNQFKVALANKVTKHVDEPRLRATMEAYIMGQMLIHHDEWSRGEVQSTRHGITAQEKAKNVYIKAS